MHQAILNSAFKLACTVALAVSFWPGSACQGDDAITQDDLGLFHGKINRLVDPVSSVPLKGVQHIKQMWITPDAMTVVLHEWVESKTGEMFDHLTSMEAGTGKNAVVLELKSGASARSGTISADGKSFITDDPDANGLIEFDLHTGKKTTTFAAPGDRPLAQVKFSIDGEKATAVTEDGGAILWDLKSATASYVKVKGAVAKDHFVIFPLDHRDELLLVLPPDDPATSQKISFVLFNPATGTAFPITVIDGNCDLRTTADGNKLYIFRQEDAQRTVWTGIEVWDLHSLKQISKQALNPAMASIGLKLSEDGNTLFLHEYLSQPVVIWDLANAKFSGLVGPNTGGCAAFDTTRDGKKLVAFVGPWTDGTLMPTNLAIYDTTPLLSKKPVK